MADAYFEGLDGDFLHIAFSGVGGRDGKETRQFIGHYKKEGGRWIVTTPSGHKAELRTTLLSLSVIETNGSKGGPWYRMFR